ncbi:MAG: WW domain-containing protein, partial [Candidatus Fonsibacter sp.]
MVGSDAACPSSPCAAAQPRDEGPCRPASSGSDDLGSKITAAAYAAAASCAVLDPWVVGPAPKTIKFKEPPVKALPVKQPASRSGPPPGPPIVGTADPDGLPTGWLKVVSAVGAYYWDTIAGYTTWKFLVLAAGTDRLV